MQNSHTKADMTQGPAMKLVLLFALPICIGNILQQLYTTVDTLVIGNFCDSVSLAAVGTSSQPVEMLLCIFLGIGTGVSILISQYTGSGDGKAVRETAATATSFLYLSAIPISILGLFLGPLILKFMQVPEDTWDLAVSYLRIIFLGTLGNMGYNMNAGILQGMGDSRASLFFLLISCFTNIVLDLLFIAGFQMDVTGAALATSLSMFASWLFSVIYIRRKYPELEFTLLPKKLNKNILRRIITVGLPLGLNNSIYSVGHIFLQALVNAQGSTFMAACSVATKLTGIANVAISSLSSAATTFSGQNYGAQKYVRLQKEGLRIPLFSGLITCIAGVAVTFFCRPLLVFFTRDEQVLELAVLYTRVVLPSMWIFAVFNGIICYVNGIGEVRFPTIANILMLWAVRIPSAWLISAFLDGTWLMAWYPISFSFGLLFLLLFFLTVNWKKIRRLAEREKASQADQPYTQIT